MNCNNEIFDKIKNENEMNLGVYDNIKTKYRNLKNFESNNENFETKKGIIIKLSNQLLKNEINLIQDSFANLDLLQLIDILNKLDNSFSCFVFNDNKSKFNSINNNNNDQNINISIDFYYQQEYNIIKSIYSKISNYYSINFKESLEIIANNFKNISNKQQNTISSNKYNKNYYYTYNILYDFIILFLILNKNGINNKEIKALSPADRIFMCESEKEQKLICNIINNYLEINSYINQENICQEIRSIYCIIELYIKINILKRKLKFYNINDCKDDEKSNDFDEFNNGIKFDEKYVKYNSLNQQDFCKIILKKDYIINQLETRIENFNRMTNNENTFRDIEEENELNKKEIEEMKKKYDLEFELMASAVYGLGINIFFSKEQQLNEKLVNSFSWLTRQKDYIMELNE